MILMTYVVTGGEGHGLYVFSVTLHSICSKKIRILKTYKMTYVPAEFINISSCVYMLCILCYSLYINIIYGGIYFILLCAKTLCHINIVLYIFSFCLAYVCFMIEGKRK